MHRFPPPPRGTQVRAQFIDDDVLRIAIPRQGWRTGPLVITVGIGWLVLVIGDALLYHFTGWWIAALFIGVFACVCAVGALFAQVLQDEPIVIELSPQTLRVGGESGAGKPPAEGDCTWARDQIEQIHYDPQAWAVLIRTRQGEVSHIAPNRDPRLLGWIEKVLNSELCEPTR